MVGLLNTPFHCQSLLVSFATVVGTVRCGTVSCGIVRCGTVRCGTVRYATVRCTTFRIAFCGAQSMALCDRRRLYKLLDVKCNLIASHLENGTKLEVHFSISASSETNSRCKHTHTGVL